MRLVRDSNGNLYRMTEVPQYKVDDLGSILVNTENFSINIKRGKIQTINYEITLTDKTTNINLVIRENFDGDEFTYYFAQDMLKGIEYDLKVKLQLPSDAGYQITKETEIYTVKKEKTHISEFEFTSYDIFHNLIKEYKGIDAEVDLLDILDLDELDKIEGFADGFTYPNTLKKLICYNTKYFGRSSFEDSNLALEVRVPFKEQNEDEINTISFSIDGEGYYNEIGNTPSHYLFKDKAFKNFEGRVGQSNYKIEENEDSEKIFVLISEKPYSFFATEKVVSEIGKEAFYGSKIKLINFKLFRSKLKEACFANSMLKKISILDYEGNSIDYLLPKSIFEDCIDLKEIIADFSFSYNIPENIFAGCSNLSVISPFENKSNIIPIYSAEAGCFKECNSISKNNVFILFEDTYIDPAAFEGVIEPITFIIPISEKYPVKYNQETKKIEYNLEKIMVDFKLPENSRIIREYPSSVLKQTDTSIIAYHDLSFDTWEQTRKAALKNNYGDYSDESAIRYKNLKTPNYTYYNYIKYVGPKTSYFNFGDFFGSQTEIRNCIKPPETIYGKDAPERFQIGELEKIYKREMRAPYKISGDAFYGTDIKFVYIPSGVSFISKDAFNGMKNAKIYFADTIETARSKQWECLNDTITEFHFNRTFKDFLNDYELYKEEEDAKD